MSNRPSVLHRLLKISLGGCLLALSLRVALPQAFSLAIAPISPAIAQTTAPTSTPTLAQTSSPTRQRSVQVFFSRFPAAGDDFTQVASVTRSTSRVSVARFAIEQLLVGPTSTERRQGLRSPVQLQGNSTCGSDFTLSINNGVARLQFCRQVVSAGVGDDARAKSAIEATLKQFATVSRVVILDSNGNCFGDQSGENLCLDS